MNPEIPPVTEREVINGVLNVKNTKNHCLAYVRYINNINLQNLRKASLFLDIANRSLDNEASKLLADLRDERLPNKIESTNLQRYLILLQKYIRHFCFNFLSVFMQVYGGMDRERGSGSWNSWRVPSTLYHSLLQKHSETRRSRHEERRQFRARTNNNWAFATPARL